jgi:hypothetical protein
MFSPSALYSNLVTKDLPHFSIFETGLNKFDAKCRELETEQTLQTQERRRPRAIQSLSLFNIRRPISMAKMGTTNANIKVPPETYVGRQRCGTKNRDIDDSHGVVSVSLRR